MWMSETRNWAAGGPASKAGCHQTYAPSFESQSLCVLGLWCGACLITCWAKTPLLRKNETTHADAAGARLEARAEHGGELVAWAGNGRFNVASTWAFRARAFQDQHACFETVPRDDQSSKNQPKRVETDRDRSL